MMLRLIARVMGVVGLVITAGFAELAWEGMHGPAPMFLFGIASAILAVVMAVLAVFMLRAR